MVPPAPMSGSPDVVTRTRPIAWTVNVIRPVTYADVDRLHRDIGKRAPIHANRVLALLSKMFSLAIRWGWRSDNPCRGIERNQEQKRRRYPRGARTGS